MTNNLPFGSVGVLPLTSPLLIRKTTTPLLCRPSENHAVPLMPQLFTQPPIKTISFPLFYVPIPLLFIRNLHEVAPFAVPDL